MTQLKDRADIEQPYKWNPETLFSDEEEWENAAEQVETHLNNLNTEHVTATAATLAEILDAYFEIWVAFERVNVYASLRSCVDATDEHAQELSGRASNLESRLKTTRSTIETEIQQADTECIEQMLTDSILLSKYKQYLHDILRRAEHTAEPEVENALSTLAPATGGSDIYQTVRDADLSFPTVEQPDGKSTELTLNNQRTLLRSFDRPFRRTVHKHFYDSLGEYRHTFAATFNKHVEAAVRTAELRGYDSSLAAALGEENVPTGVYDTLVETVQANLDPLHDHLLRKRARLGIETLRPWDITVRLVDDDPTISYEQAKEYVVKAVEPLGDAYQTRLARGLESGWVDVYETPNKASGAFTIPAYSTQPFVLLNYQRDVNWLFGLAHEVGHAMHAELTSDSQPMVYGYFDRFVSEVPSTLTEILLVQHLLETTDDSALRRVVLDMWLERFRDLLYRRTRYAVCERQMHEQVADGKQLTAERLDRCFVDSWETFNAPVECDDQIAGEWMHTGYLNAFDEPFFVYQYATGFSAALALATDIRTEWDGSEPGDTAERYLRFLRSGSSEYSVKLIADAGVDLTSATPIERAIDTYRESLAALEEMI
ncbi:M3 family oligoendopeptidase [Halomarina pelagica]|uniref:M3 family oligoendopeptidase n=1 Tax=Halomarina pelagica TaxID=2961599 RepID=UPI0020C3E5D7|nr:M3 family oligoendopeptidase [Halomarina sp. BND7]